MTTNGIRERNPVLHSFKILEALSLADAPLALNEFAEFVPVHKTTVLRLLTTLLELGYVERDPTSSRYKLSAGLISLAGAALQKNPLAMVAQPIMDNIARTTRETVTLSIWNIDHAVDVAMSPGLEPITYSPTLGMRNPAHCTATGKIFLSALDEEGRQKILGGPLEQYTSQTITDQKDLLTTLDEVRATGIAWSREEFTDNLCAIGVPIGHSTAGPVGALVVSIPLFRFTQEKQKLCVDSLKKGAHSISARLS